MIKAVFLDIDNTLLDFDAYVVQAMREGFRDFGFPEYRPEMYETFHRVNSGLWRALEKGEMTFDELQHCRWNRVFEALGFSGDGWAFEKAFRARLWDSAIPVPGAMELLAGLKGRYVLCAASNGPYAQQCNRIQVGGMAPYFDHVFISEKIGVSKPAKEFFDACFEALNAGRAAPILPEDCLMVGDSLTSDMAGGLNAGMQTCFFDRKGGTDTKGMKLDFVIRSLADLAEILK